jgi:23S rRNA pseudouridine2605 synthase
VGIKLKTANVKVVRSIFEKFGYNVLKVDRVAFAGLTKKNLPRGNWRFLTEQEVINLKNF